MLDLAGCTATQRLTCAGWAVGLLVNATGLLLVEGLGDVADGVGVADVVAFGAALAVLVCVAVGLAVVLEVLAGVGVELVDDLAVAVVVLGLADVDAFDDADELAVAVGDFEALGVAVAVLEVLGDGCGLGEVLGVVVGVGVAVGEGVADCNGWHCCTAPVDVATWAADAAGENPEAAAARTPPVTTPATTGCTCAIRMKGPPVLFVATSERIFGMEWLHQA